MLTGTDDLWSGFDSAFVRRFFARQITTGCTAVDDCSGATGHVAQALVQLREPQYPNVGARRIPSGTKALRVLWTADRLRAGVVHEHVTEVRGAGLLVGMLCWSFVARSLVPQVWDLGRRIVVRWLRTDTAGQCWDPELGHRQRSSEFAAV